MSHQAPSIQQSVRGRLHLEFACDRQQQCTRLVASEQQPPLRIIRAFPLPAGGTLVHLHNLSGGVLGGDHLDIAIIVGPHSRVQLTSTGATRLYRSRPDASLARQTTTVSIAENALLEYLPDQIIPFAGSRYQQRTRIDLCDNAGLFWWEIVAAGRSARGEIFAYDLLEIDLSIFAGGRPIAIERAKLAPASRALSSPARLGPYTCFASFYICHAGLPSKRWLEIENELRPLVQTLSRPGEIVWGISSLVAHGLLVRAVSYQSRDISAGLLVFWQAAKRLLYNEDAIPPRKLY
ncbi:MAG: urease accessory protein UreD [Ktedonobacteraceae bacterium]|nr:urease accessory protein UreD [Ktedonobacteraceae bacterium]